MVIEILMLFHNNNWLRFDGYYRSHEQGHTQSELKRFESASERRLQEIQNLAVAKQAKDAEVVELVHQLEGLTAEVCATRE